MWDFQMEDILGNVADYSVRQAWDILQESQRQLHLAGRKKESVVCNKCHHGAKKKAVSVNIEGDERSDYGYDYKKDFEGCGLNRKQ